MASRPYHLVIDSREPSALAESRAGFLDQPVLFRPDDVVMLGATPHARPGLSLVRDASTKTAKNRLQRELDPDDREAEVRRILALGARSAGVGQSTDLPWAVLAGTEGNEIYLLRPHVSPSNSFPLSAYRMRNLR
jgi:hypothetical protein